MFYHFSQLVEDFIKIYNATYKAGFWQDIFCRAFCYGWALHPLCQDLAAEGRVFNRKPWTWKGATEGRAAEIWIRVSRGHDGTLTQPFACEKGQRNLNRAESQRFLLRGKTKVKLTLRPNNKSSVSMKETAKVHQKSDRALSTWETVGFFSGYRARDTLFVD